MKELEARTGVNREAIRFYIREGLLPEPEKPRRNVAIYSEQHVARTKLIKKLQDSHYLPLKLVKSVLDSPESQKLASNEVPGMAHFLPAFLRDTEPGPDRTINEISKESGLPKADILALANLGAISISEEDRIDFRDAAIITAWGKAQEYGFNAERGYTDEFFAHYVEATKMLAENEVERFFAQFDTDDGQSAAAQGAAGIEIANKIITLLHTKFILQAIQRRTTNQN